MAARLAIKLEAFLEERTDGRLRSIVKYEDQSYDVVYLREDVAGEYTDEQIKRAVDESILDSISAPVYEDVFSDDHGELICLVQCYENVVEMNFVLDDGVGAVVALDEKALAETSGLVADARDIVIEERT